jgi:hypothetical protein
MNDHITIFVNGIRIRIYRGMKVKHALIARDYLLYAAALEGRLAVYDDSGFRVGLEGALHDGARITTREVA